MAPTEPIIAARSDQPIPRYSTHPFPAYRYIPGRLPHPTAHPAGHSVGPSQPVGVDPLIKEGWPQHPQYQFGIDLFNHGFWWEAHEAWESLWQASDRQAAAGLFLQGLIQYAAVLLKLYQGTTRGVDGLLRGAMAKLAQAEAECQAEGVSASALSGFHFPAWRARAAAFVQVARSTAGEDPLRMSGYPVIVLSSPRASSTGA